MLIVISIEVESIPKCDEWIRNISELMNERTVRFYSFFFLFFKKI